MIYAFSERTRVSKYRHSCELLWNASGSWMTSYPFHLFALADCYDLDMMYWLRQGPICSQENSVFIFKKKMRGEQEREFRMRWSRERWHKHRSNTTAGVSRGSSEECIRVCLLMPCMRNATDESRPSQWEDHFAWSITNKISFSLEHALNIIETKTFISYHFFFQKQNNNKKTVIRSNTLFDK